MKPSPKVISYRKKKFQKQYLKPLKKIGDNKLLVLVVVIILLVFMLTIDKIT